MPPKLAAATKTAADWTDRHTEILFRLVKEHYPDQLKGAAIRSADEELAQWEGKYLNSKFNTFYGKYDKNKKYDPLDAVAPMVLSGGKRAVAGKRRTRTIESDPDSDEITDEYLKNEEESIFRMLNPSKYPVSSGSSSTGPLFNSLSGPSSTAASRSFVTPKRAPLGPAAAANAASNASASLPPLAGSQKTPQVSQDAYRFNPSRPMVLGTHVPLHHPIRFFDEGKYHALVIFSGIDAHTSSFKVVNNGQHLECSLSPLKNAAADCVDPKKDATHPESLSIIQYFANSEPKPLKYVIEFPEPVDSKIINMRPIFRTIYVEGRDAAGKDHSVAVQQPVAYALTYLISGQDSDNIVGYWGSHSV
ncbi:hypothetical protein HDU98_002768 [Podochytrium sp. JEL0797]|nr:hypothetical protein HDU98_002768 [Podochytrium sp. JEL0797]